MTLNDVIEVLASELRIDEASVAWLARKLQDARLLPADAEREEFLPLHAARLLVALLAASRPIDAAATVAAYERTSMAAGSAATNLPENFVAAVARLIESVVTDSTTPMPGQIRARRSLCEPLGLLVGKVTLVYGPSGAGDGSMAGDVLQVYGTAPGAVLQAVASLLCSTDNSRPPRGPEQPPQSWPAQLRSPARLDSRSAGDAAARA